MRATPRRLLNSSTTGAPTGKNIGSRGRHDHQATTPGNHRPWRAATTEDHERQGRQGGSPVSWVGDRDADRRADGDHRHADRPDEAGKREGARARRRPRPQDAVEVDRNHEGQGREDRQEIGRELGARQAEEQEGDGAPGGEGSESMALQARR
jgi:hypothetical protein